MKKIILLSCFAGLGINSVYAQQATLDSLFQATVQEFNPAGWVRFLPNTVSLGTLFTQYKPVFLPEPGDSLVLFKTWTDNQIQYNHNRYRQEYNGIPVEGAEFTEHLKNGYVVYANGKLCPDINTKYEAAKVTEIDALNTYLELHSECTFAWEDTDWEEDLQTTTGNLSATHYPDGELVFALKKDGTIQYNLDANDYVLAWKFDVLCSSPFSHNVVYVDALSGSILKEVDQICYNGSANITGHGPQTIDTRWQGFPHNRHILHSNDNNINVHTKNFDGHAFSFTGEVHNPTTSWGSNHPQSTTAHWMITQTWDYFLTEHGRKGIDEPALPNSNNTNEVKVFADYEWDPTPDASNFAFFSHHSSSDFIYAGYLDSTETVYSGELSILAHEYTHGISYDEVQFDFFFEPGALNESFSDIFGFLTRTWVTGVTDWTVGIPGVVSTQRSLQFPTQFGFHGDTVTNQGITTWQQNPGQPDTYGGTFWYDHTAFSDQIDRGGIHINSSIQNHWFYLICQGGSGTNDNGDAYSVNAIGTNDAAEIVYYSLVNEMQTLSIYDDAREGSIIAAEELFGECSAQAIAVEQAWFAVGVGPGSTCQGADMDEVEINFTIFPNPSSDMIQLQFDSGEEKDINIYSINGQLVYSKVNYASNNLKVDISNLERGLYIVKVNGKQISQSKFIKQ